MNALPQSESIEFEPASSPVPVVLLGGELSLTDTPASVVEPMDFRKPKILLGTELRKLRAQHEMLMEKLSRSLSQHFKTPCQLALKSMEPLTCGELSQRWDAPSQLSIFKLEPLRGIALLQVSQPLGASLLDVLMGGSGQLGENFEPHELTDVEKALFEQTSRIILEAWCASWTHGPQLKPQILAVESDTRFLEVAEKDVMMLAVIAEFTTESVFGEIHLAIPLFALESLVKSRRLQAEGGLSSSAQEKTTPSTPELCHTFFDEVPVNISASWEGIELNAQQVLGLKPGAVFRLDSGHAASVSVKIGDQTRFKARPGTLSGDWAVELTTIVKDQ